LVRALEQRGDRVVGLVRKSSNLARLCDYNVQFVYGDITDRNALRAAMTGVQFSYRYVELGLVNEVEMERVNLGNLSRAESSPSGWSVKIVYCSTIGVFGDTKGKVINETNEHRPTFPLPM